MKSTLKKALFQLVYITGRPLHDGGITILSYHSIDDLGTPLSVSPGLFAKQMSALAREKCPTFTMREVAEHLASGKKFPPRAMAITFDDGFENLYTQALPVLQKYRLKATVYIITGMVGKSTHWTDCATTLPSLPILDWDQIKALQQAGIEIGAHSVTHGFMTQYSTAQLHNELTEPKMDLEQRLGAPIYSFAYPQGDYDARVTQAVKQAGYRTASTVDQGRARIKSDPLTLPRILVSNNTTPAMMRAYASPTIGVTYALINFVIRRLLGRKKWPRRNPGEVQSSETIDTSTGKP